MRARMRAAVSYSRYLPLFIGLSILVAGYAVVNADVSPAGDSVSARDGALYKQLGLKDRFGLLFRAHKMVCTDASDGEAHCNARVITDDAGRPVAAARAISGYGPAQFLKAYNLTGQAPTAGTIIAIVDAYDHPNIQSDLNTYSTHFGIPQLPACTGPIATSAQPCFKKVNQLGGTAKFPRTNPSWALEISLDVEVAHAICQNCSILLVEANSSNYTDLMAAVDRAVALGATVVSNSYGSAEFSTESTYDSHFNHPGVAFTVSSGDGGYGVQYPAASPYVTAVGGTSLFLNADGTYAQELAWSGSGSGCSSFEGKPAWQSDPLCAKRTVADVSAVADPNTGAAVYDSVRYAGKVGWWQVGGTSLSAPLIAGVYALSGNTSGSANALPYALATGANMHDVVSGSNGTTCGSSYLCTALAGYDGPTGLGTPNGASAF